MKNAFSVYYSPKGPENISLAGHQNQGNKRCPLGDTHTNWGTRKTHKLLLKRYLGAGVRQSECKDSADWPPSLESISGSLDVC